MRQASLFFLLVICNNILFAQDINAIINATAVKRIEQILSSDNMQGRAAFTAGAEKAADFISNEFKAAGLQTWDNNPSYRQSFAIIKTKLDAISASLDDHPIQPNQIQAFTSGTDISINQNSGYQKVFIKADDIFIDLALKYIQSHKNYIVLVDTVFSKKFAELANFKSQQFKSARNIIFLLSNIDPTAYSIHIQQQVSEAKLANVIGVLPGTSKKNEYVIFSAHYDHLGMTKPNEKKDSVYNGANDDASGVTAVIMLANYFKKIKNNERTLIFVAFTAEEFGGYGSQYFSEQIDPDKVVAMFNIEMIGTESKWGINSAYITGYKKTDMGSILGKNLANSKFKFYPDPYLEQDLFYRSDNATLAKQGVPAHTISTSKMDSEKNYHELNDEIGTLNITNMTEIIKAIALSSKSIVQGKDRPTRVKEE